ncbi:unnamed protein product [Adineta ricciae]|uniref:Uncharacterized protein n=1 Tax=Adineta ricciae TaxID=249248 RepID=A0A815JQT3_ADIRI|nr:unnamed protein product [Adineta ricciae]
MEFIKIWTKANNLESTKVKVALNADIDDVKEEIFGKEKNKYYAMYKNQKLTSSTPAPTDTTDAKPIIFLKIH